MWTKYDGKVKYNTAKDWYEVEINGSTMFVCGSTLDEDDAVTEYEAKFRAQGVKIKRLIAVKEV